MSLPAPGEPYRPEPAEEGTTHCERVELAGRSVPEWGSSPSPSSTPSTSSSSPAPSPRQSSDPPYPPPAAARAVPAAFPCASCGCCCCCRGCVPAEGPAAVAPGGIPAHDARLPHAGAPARFTALAAALAPAPIPALAPAPGKPDTAVSCAGEWTGAGCCGRNSAGIGVKGTVRY